MGGRDMSKNSQVGKLEPYCPFTLLLDVLRE